MVECRVVNVNLVAWTVDVVTVYDRRRYFNVQVASPYLHHNNGEGIYVVPEIHAKCVVCVPSDSSPPHVAYFLMASENVGLASEEAPEGTTSKSVTGSKTTGSSFAGGRGRYKPGDIIMKGRDGNFVVMHRGGVLEVGATELCQRIFIPLSNTMVDISENYYHHGQGGTEYWGVLPGRNDQKSATEYFQSFRVFAEDKFADVRVKIGHVGDPATGQVDGEARLSDVYYEVTVAPQGVDPDSGAYHDVKQTVFRIAVDKSGNVVLGAKVSMTVFGKELVRIQSENRIVIKAGADIDMRAASGASIDGGTHLDLRGGVVKIGPGQKPVARQGDLVRVTFPFTPMTLAPVPLVLNGIIITGAPTVLS